MGRHGWVWGRGRAYYVGLPFAWWLWVRQQQLLKLKAAARRGAVQCVTYALIILLTPLFIMHCLV